MWWMKIIFRSVVCGFLMFASFERARDLPSLPLVNRGASLSHLTINLHVYTVSLVAVYWKMGRKRSRRASELIDIKWLTFALYRCFTAYFFLLFFFRFAFTYSPLIDALSWFLHKPQSKVSNVTRKRRAIAATKVCRPSQAQTEIRCFMSLSLSALYFHSDRRPSPSWAFANFPVVKQNSIVELKEWARHDMEGKHIFSAEEKRGEEKPQTTARNSYIIIKKFFPFMLRTGEDVDDDGGNVISLYDILFEFFSLCMLRNVHSRQSQRTAYSSPVSFWFFSCWRMMVSSLRRMMWEIDIPPFHSSSTVLCVVTHKSRGWGWCCLGSQSEKDKCHSIVTEVLFSRIKMENWRWSLARRSSKLGH